VRSITAELIWAENRFQQGLSILVDEDRIAEVGPVDEVAGTDQVEDWGRVAVVPGTVNAHGHAFQNLFKGFADDRPFESWRDDVLYPFSERLNEHAIYVGALFAFAEALLAGVTTTVDFFYLHDASNENAEAVIRAARDVGIRLVLARAFYDPEAPTSAPARYREPAGEAAERCRSLADAHQDDPFIEVQPAPHSLHAASPETISVALELAAAMGCPCHLHLAEAAYERELVQSRYGVTPVRLLAREGLLDPRLLTVHTVWVDDEELDLLAEAGAGVVHCAGANAFLGDGVARLPEMLSRGIRVALGPDGGCANNRQSVFDEMRQATLMAKARLIDGGAINAATAFRLGTAAGAELLDISAGSIKPEALADLVALDLDDLSLQPLATIDRQVVNSMQPTAIAKVMVGGRVVVDGSRLTQLEPGMIQALVAEVTSGWEIPPDSWRHASR
jgi:5-methylthioadenosine/S-adenosylhomocysteine deaminase